MDFDKNNKDLETSGRKQMSQLDVHDLMISGRKNKYKIGLFDYAYTMGCYFYFSLKVILTDWALV